MKARRGGAHDARRVRDAARQLESQVGARAGHSANRQQARAGQRRAARDDAAFAEEDLLQRAGHPRPQLDRQRVDAGLTGVQWTGLNKTLIAIVLSPTLGLILTMLIMLGTSWLGFRRTVRIRIGTPIHIR